MIGPGTTGRQRDRRGNISKVTLESHVNRVFPNITSELVESEVDHIYKIVTERWLAQVEKGHSELLSILNDLLSETFDSSAYDNFRLEPVDDFVELILDRLHSISPERLQEAELRFKQCTKPYDVFGSHVNNVIDTALGMHGIPKDEIPIARYHKIQILDSSAHSSNPVLKLWTNTTALPKQVLNRLMIETNSMKCGRSLIVYRLTILRAGEWEFAGHKKEEFTRCSWKEIDAQTSSHSERRSGSNRKTC